MKDIVYALIVFGFFLIAFITMYYQDNRKYTEDMFKDCVEYTVKNNKETTDCLFLIKN